MLLHGFSRFKQYSVVFAMVKLFLALIICALHLLSTAEGSLQRKKKEILDQLLDPNKYDPQMKPGVLSDVETRVGVAVSLHVLSISKIDDLNMLFTMEMYMRQHWKDERLVYQSPSHQIEYVYLNEHNRIWVPDLFFVNEHKSYLHDIMEPNSCVKILPDGSVLSSARVTLVLRCPMNFALYPMDTHTCSMRIESYKWKGSEINLEWKNETDLGVTVGNEILSPLFTLDQYWTTRGLVAVASGEYSMLELKFQFSRNIQYYIIQVYIPCCMVFIVSCLPFWLNPRLITARVLIGIATLLSTGFHITAFNSQAPKTPYPKAIDVFSGMVLTFIFFSLLETIFVHIVESRSNTRLQKQESVSKDDVEQNEKMPYKPNVMLKMKAWLYDDHETLNDIDAASRSLFPVCFLLFLFIYTLTCVSLRAM